jgi:hypothetical protein
MAERKGFSELLVRPFGLTGSNPFNRVEVV